MTVTDAREFGHDVVGDAVFLSHCNPALHALVGILRITPRQVALQLGISPARMSHYLNMIDPIPYDRRKSIVDLLDGFGLPAQDRVAIFAYGQDSSGGFGQVGSGYHKAELYQRCIILGARKSK